MPGYVIADCQEGAYRNSPAKLNVGLSIVGRRPDGYHLLESLFWPIDFVDEIRFFPSPSPCTLAARWSEDAPVRRPLPPANQNIVSTLLDSLPFCRSLLGRIELTKRIPIGGGLGGGSSNAGTLIRYLSDRFPDEAAKLRETAERLGSDVPFFLAPTPTWVSGAGEQLQPLKIDAALEESLHFLLVLMPFSVSTQGAYEAVRQRHQPFSLSRRPFDPARMSSESFAAYLRTATNDLELVVMEQHPLIGAALGALRQTRCLFASLTGSGSTCFAIYSSSKDCSVGLKDLQPFLRNSNCRSVTARTYKL